MKKVAKTCQKQGKAKKSFTSSDQVTEEIETKDQSVPEREPEAPTARPRNKRDKPSIKTKVDPEKFDPQKMVEKSAMLFRSAEQHQSISMNTDPRPRHQNLLEAAKPSSSRGSIKLRGFSCKSDSDSGFDADSVGEIKIKQVGG